MNIAVVRQSCRPYVFPGLIIVGLLIRILIVSLTGEARLGYFCLSTDQLLATQAFSLRTRLLRAAGVLVCWLTLPLALVGWHVLRRQYPELAGLFVAYAVVITVVHLPFVMNARYRIPVIDPLLSILASGGFFLWSSRGPGGAPLPFRTALGIGSEPQRAATKDTSLCGS